MTRDYIVWLFWAYGGTLLAMLCCGWALWRGGRPERLFGAVLGGTWLLSWAVDVLFRGHETPLIIAIDCGDLIAFTAISLRWRRLWLAFAVACQLNDVITHLVDKLTGFDAYSYITMLGIWGGYAQIACLFCGMMTRRRRTGPAQPSSRTEATMRAKSAP